MKHEVAAQGTATARRIALAVMDWKDRTMKLILVYRNHELGEAWAEQGNDPALFRREIQSVARQMVDLFVDEGRSVKEIREMLADGRLRP